MKIYFYNNLLLFYLAIYLKVKYDGKLSFNTKKIIKWWLELRYKNCSIDTNNRIKETVVLHYYINNYFCKFWSINSDFN